MERFDVIIVGTGPAGIFAALELVESRRGMKVLMVEKGKDLGQRRCPIMHKDIPCISCKECSVTSGWGGAGAFSDGKLTISPDIGGHLLRYVEREKLNELIAHVDRKYMKYGAPKKIFGGDRKQAEAIAALASKNDLEFIPAALRHMGTDRCPLVLKKMKAALDGKVKITFNTSVEKVVVRDGRARGVALSDGREVAADYVILAPGREGSKWLEGESRRLGLSTLKNPVDIGVRVEVPASVLEHLTSVLHEPKFVFHSKTFEDRARTFCVNPYGEVVMEHIDGVWAVNGHSYSRKKTANTNFALLVSTSFTEPFDEPITYGRYIAGLANLLGKGVLVQRLGDLRAGRRSTPERIRRGLVRPTLKGATPGDLSFAIPYRHLSDILEMLEALDRVAPGVNSRHTLLYGTEVKFYSMQLKLTASLETELKNLFAAGDGAGVSRGLVQASASGVIAAREILGRVA